jgi:hypothetical protein
MPTDLPALIKRCEAEARRGNLDEAETSTAPWISALLTLTKTW